MSRVPAAERSPQLLSETLPEVSASCHRLPSRWGWKGGFQPSSCAQRETERTKAQPPPNTPCARLQLGAEVPRCGGRNQGWEGSGGGQRGGRSAHMPACGAPAPDPELLTQLPQMQKRPGRVMPGVTQQVKDRTQAGIPLPGSQPWARGPRPGRKGCAWCQHPDLGVAARVGPSRAGRTQATAAHTLLVWTRAERLEPRPGAERSAPGDELLARRLEPHQLPHLTVYFSAPVSPPDFRGGPGVETRVQDYVDKRTLSSRVSFLGRGFG